MPKRAKRKSTISTTKPAVPVKKSKPDKSKTIFNNYIKVYKGLDDFHMPVLKEVQKFTLAKSVLYPGSGRHINPSLFYPDVLYVDSDMKTGDVCSDPAILEWIAKHKIYEEKPKIRFSCKNFSSDFGEKPGTFDLVISSSAGLVSDSCKQYCKIGGHFLASDCHLDARRLNLDSNFSLVGMMNDAERKLETSSEELKGCFTLKKTGESLTKAQVDEIVKDYKRKKAYPLMKTAMFFLFKRIK